MPESMNRSTDEGPTLKQEFHDRLLAAANEVRRHTRLGVKGG